MEFVALYIDPALELLSLFFSVLGINVILISAVRSLIVLWKTHDFIKTRTVIAGGILLSLDYLVAGDVVRTIYMPYYYQLGILAGLVLIRTVLSYFLSKELHS